MKRSLVDGLFAWAAAFSIPLYLMLPALFLIPLVALFRIWLAWQPGMASNWLLGCSPLAAVALCAGLFLPRRLALVIPLGILLASDAIIDAHYGAHFFSLLTLSNYALLAAIGLFGLNLRCFTTRWPQLPRGARDDAGSLRVFLRGEQHARLVRL